MSAAATNSLTASSCPGYGGLFGFLARFINAQIPDTKVLTLTRTGAAGFDGAMPVPARPG